MYAAHQYVTLFLIVAVEEGGLPLPAPSDLVIAFYGYRARDEPIELAKIVLICAAASTAGTLVPYAVARRFGPGVAQRLGGWLDVSPSRLATWRERIRRRGFAAVVVGRLIPGLRVAMSLMAGTSEVPLAAFSAGVFVAATLYWALWVVLGVLLGPAVVDLIAPAYYGYAVLLVPVVLVVAFAARIVVVRRRHQR